MPDFTLDREALTKIMDLMEHQFGPDCEIILHDLTGDYDKTIIDIRNGHITNRKVGDCGSNLGLEVIRGTVSNGDRFNYITRTRNGKTLRSSTVYFYNEEKQLIGALCVNTDISESIRLEEYLREINRYSPKHEENGEEFFANNVSDLLEYLIQEGMCIVGKQCEDMTKQDKLKMLQFLDGKGAFLITKSSEKICEVLGISKFTLYNYLDILRNGSDKGTGK